jgi:hypothetical protein
MSLRTLMLAGGFDCLIDREAFHNLAAFADDYESRHNILSLIAIAQNFVVHANPLN